jgi:acetyltransferase-like isoleucine patch superfamily enzyme
MEIIKYLWVIRAIFYNLYWGKFGFFGYIGKPIIIINARKIFIEKKVRILPLSRMEVKNINDNASIEISEDVSIGQGLHIISGGLLTIGTKTTISGNVLITNIDHCYEKIGTHIMNQPLVVKDTTIGKNCFIGANVVIQAGTSLGEQCIVGANSVVKGVFPSHCVIVGVPAKIIKIYDHKINEWVKYKQVKTHDEVPTISTVQ